MRSIGIYAPDFAVAAPKCDSQLGLFCGVHTHIPVVAWSYIGGSICPSTSCTETHHEVQAVWGCCIWAGEAPQVLPRAARRRNLGFIAPMFDQLAWAVVLTSEIIKWTAETRALRTTRSIGGHLSKVDCTMENATHRIAQSRVDFT